MRIIYVMARYELSKEWIEKNGRRVLEAYGSAIARGYDVASVKDVLKLLSIIDPENATEENAEILSGILQLFAKTLKRAIKRRYEPGQKLKEKIVN